LSPQKTDLEGTIPGDQRRLKEALAPILRSVRVIAGPQAKVRLFLVSGAGKGLIPAVSESTVGVRKASATRPEAIAERKAKRVDLNDASKHSVALVPLVSRHEVLGLLEVIGPSEAINSAWSGLRSIADQGALSLRMLKETASLHHELQTSRRLGRLAHGLVRTRSSSKAVDEVARVLFEAFGAPVITWAVKADLTRPTLLSVYGFSSAASSRLEANMRSIRRLSAGGPQAKSELIASIQACVTLTEATAIDAGDAVIVIGGASPEIMAAVRFVQPMLKDVLHRLGIMALADLQHERLDLGISWTAHELRGPLTGTRAVIDLLLQTADEESRTQHLLKRSREDLDRLSALVDGVLRVTMTNQSLTQRPTVLMPVIGDAINMCRAERPNVQINVRSRAEVVLQADPPHLTGALANVLRNSLWHSPTSAPIDIDIIARGASVEIRISDKGPRVSGADKEMIFDPFGRGESPRAVGRGKGLGLFIARRVIEGHGGTIKVGSTSSGAMFVIDLPIPEERRQASAS
jgi:signal transduction histidine kinase